jgi:hypothetical protein
MTMTVDGAVHPTMLSTNRITTLIGPPGLELAALTVAIAVSYKLGVEIMNGWCPAQRERSRFTPTRGPGWTGARWCRTSATPLRFQLR